MRKAFGLLAAGIMAFWLGQSMAYAGPANGHYNSSARTVQKEKYTENKEERDRKLSKDYGWLRGSMDARAICEFLDHVPREYYSASRLLKAGILSAIASRKDPEFYGRSLEAIQQLSSELDCAETQFLLGYYMHQLATHKRDKNMAEEAKRHFEKALEAEPYSGDDLRFKFFIDVQDFRADVDEGWNVFRYFVGAKGASSIFLGKDPHGVLAYVELDEEHRKKGKTAEEVRTEANVNVTKYLRISTKEEDTGLWLSGKCEVKLGDDWHFEILVDPSVDLDELWKKYIK